MVEISNEEYSELLRQSEQLEMVKRLIDDSKYMPSHDIKIILGIKEEEDE